MAKLGKTYALSRIIEIPRKKNFLPNIKRELYRE